MGEPTFANNTDACAQSTEVDGPNLERPKTPESTNTKPPTSTESSPITPREDVPPIAVGSSIESYSSSASSTPRDESSSGSPSPIPDDFIGENGLKQKPKVKLGKDISLMMQALNSLQSPEEKIAALCKKYADLLEQQKIMQKQLKISQRKQSQSVKEKEQLQAESNKAVLAKGKLENLARELQKRNKALQEEQSRKSMEEVTLRQEMAANFQTTVNRIESQMRNAVEGSKQIQSENEKMGGKLNEIVAYHKNREEAMQKLLKQYEMQDKLLSKELERTILVQAEQKEQDQAEKKKLLEQLLERNQLYENKLKQEKELRAQLNYYSDKFEDFQSTLEKSNEIFTSYRTEMDKMGKKLKQAEKERMKIQKKWEDATKALAETVDYTQQLEAKQARLERLSRALQTERNMLTQKVRELGGEAPTTAKATKKKENKKAAKKLDTQEKVEEPNPNVESPTLEENQHKQENVTEPPTPDGAQTQDNEKAKTDSVQSTDKPVCEENSETPSSKEVDQTETEDADKSESDSTNRDQSPPEQASDQSSNIASCDKDMKPNNEAMTEEELTPQESMQSTDGKSMKEEVSCQDGEEKCVAQDTPEPDAEN
uniref:Gamma-taxilin n=1 Tax=Phallusia mammillata TaxID=59560 RepID=A0A6F9DAF0_9ASCI|nr:gamma-taxilin [Phallusia mammillata]